MGRMCYIAPLQKPVRPHLAFASARLMALRRLAAGRALHFEQELCSIKALQSSLKVYEGVLKALGSKILKGLLSILGLLVSADLVSVHFSRGRG